VCWCIRIWLLLILNWSGLICCFLNVFGFIYLCMVVIFLSGVFRLGCVNFMFGWVSAIVVSKSWRLNVV